MVYGKDEISALADVLAKYPDTWVITDDIYNRMVFDGVGYHNFVHARPELRDRVIFIDSLSKTYGMPGWRVGFMAGPESVANALTTMNSNHITNLPEVVTAAAIAALSGPQDVPQQKNTEFQGKRDQVMAPCAHSRRGVPAAARRVLRIPGYQRCLREVARRAAESTTMSTSAMPCWKPRAWPACRARHSASRARCESATPARRRNLRRACSASRNSSPNWNDRQAQACSFPTRWARARHLYPRTSS